jgi:hypothetical protein
VPEDQRRRELACLRLARAPLAIQVPSR